MRRILLLLAIGLAGCAKLPPSSDSAGNQGDAAFARLADEYLAGYLAWRPQMGTSLGFHEYDGQITDFNQRSLDAELARVKMFDERLARLNPERLGRKAFYDFRILRGAIKREIFGFEQMRIYSQNPMTYAGTLDVNIYIKRNFAPLENRVQSLTAILNQAPK